jgi:hypothetical protein
MEKSKVLVDDAEFILKTWSMHFPLAKKIAGIVDCLLLGLYCI